MSVTELGMVAMPLKEELAHLVRYHEDNNTITIHAGGYSYEVDLDRIESPVQLLAWVNHLCEKTWMRADVASEFIEKTCKLKGWDSKLHML